MPDVLTRWAVLAVPLVLILSSCAGAVTESEEYLALQSDRDELKTSLDETTSRLETAEELAATTQAELDEVRGSLSNAESALEESNTEIADLEASLSEAEDALDAEINRPWPDALKEVFLAGCTESPAEGLTAEQNQAMCECTLTELQDSVTFVDFMTFSMLAFAATETELDPFTGLPQGLDQDFADALISAGTTCVLEL